MTSYTVTIGEISEEISENIKHIIYLSTHSKKQRVRNKNKKRAKIIISKYIENNIEEAIKMLIYELECYISTGNRGNLWEDYLG